MSEERNPKDDQEAPEGAIRKTRRVRKKRKVEQTTPDETPSGLFSKAKEILLGMHDPDEDFGHVNVAEQVRRIKSRSSDDKNRPLDEVWGTKRRSTAWLWILLGTAIVSVIAVVLGVTLWLSDEEAGKTSLEDNGFGALGKVDEVDVAEGALGWFDDHSVEVLAEVREIMAKMNEAEDSKEVESMIRKSPYRQMNPIRLEEWGSAHVTNSASDFRWSTSIVAPPGVSDSAGMGVLSVVGKREDFEPYEVYFVREGGSLKLDWDATMGWSEKSIKEVSEEKPTKPIFMRCRISKKASFDQKFGADDFSGYLLSGEFSDEYLLAYLNVSGERGKAIDRGLKLLLNYGSTIGKPLLRNQKGTVVVKFEPGVGKGGIFEIVDYLHEGWVSPVTAP